MFIENRGRFSVCQASGPLWDKEPDTPQLGKYWVSLADDPMRYLRGDGSIRVGTGGYPGNGWFDSMEDVERALAKAGETKQEEEQ